MAGGADQGVKTTWLALVPGCTTDQIGDEVQCDAMGCERVAVRRFQA